jgi:hypothetical protein
MCGKRVSAESRAELRSPKNQHAEMPEPPRKIRLTQTREIARQLTECAFHCLTTADMEWWIAFAKVLFAAIRGFQRHRANDLSTRCDG